MTNPPDPVKQDVTYALWAVFFAATRAQPMRLWEKFTAKRAMTHNIRRVANGADVVHMSDKGARPRASVPAIHIAVARTVSDLWVRAPKPKTEYSAWLHQDLRVATLRWVAQWAEQELPALSVRRIKDDFPESKDELSCEDLLIGLCAKLDLWRQPGGPPPLAVYDRIVRLRVSHWNQVLFKDLAQRAFLLNWFGNAATAAMVDMHSLIAFESVQWRHMGYLQRQRETKETLLAEQVAQAAAASRAGAGVPPRESAFKT